MAPLLDGVRAGLRYVPGGTVSVRGRIGGLIAAEAGAQVRTADGRPFPDDILQTERAMLVACNDEDMNVLVEAVRRLER